MRYYWSATIVSVLAHAALIVVVAWGWQFSSKPPEIKAPSYIKASLVELKAKAPRKAEPKQAEKKAPQKKPDELKKAQQRIKQEKQAAKKKAEQKKQQQAKEKAAQEARENQLAKEKAKKEKAEKEKQRKEKAKKELQKQAERERKALAKSAKEEIKRELAKQAALERQAAEEAGIAQSYISLIAARVERAWNRPPSARNGMKVVLKIKLVPTGQVVNVSVSKSSGDSVFDRSAVRAIQRVERFPEIQDMPTSVFENNFRELTFIFNPQDLRQ